MGRKRARDEAAAPPAPALSALARRKAAAAHASAASSIPSSIPAPSKPPRPVKPVEEPRNEAKIEPEAVDEPSASSSDDEGPAQDNEDDGVAEAERLALKGPNAGPRRHQRYFAVRDPGQRGIAAHEDEPRATSPMSEDEPDQAPSPASAVAGPSTPARLALDPLCRSSFAPSLGANLLHEGNDRIVGLQVDETVIVSGVARIRVIRGRISVDGALLTPASTALDIFAPSTHPLPVLTARTPETSDASTSAAAAILPDAAVVVRLESRQTGIEGIQRPLHASGVLARSEQMWPGAEGGRSFEFVLEPRPGVTALRVLPVWSAALDNACGTSADDALSRPRPVVLVEGAKRTGKSTLAKLVVNRLLQHHDEVAYLDTDLGQPELGPPGLVSLHVLAAPLIGPSFTHHHRPRPARRAHFLGDLSPASDPERYIEAVTDLIETAAVDLGALPVVVNTAGWVKGLGEDLLVQLKRLVRPTHVLRLGHLDPSSSSQSAEQQDHDEGGQLVATLPAIEMPSPPHLSAAESRTLSLLAYLHRISGDDGDGEAAAWDFTAPLTHRRPRVLDWTKAIEAIHVLHHRIERPHILYALNASLVALVALDADAAAVHDLPFDPDRPLPSPSSSHCLGLALIRGIDVERHAFHVLSPVSPPPPPSPLTLVKGDIELPTIGLLDWTQPTLSASVDGQAAEYLDAAPLRSDVVGAAKRKVRRNLQRR